MAQQNSSNESLLGLQHFEEFYLPGGDLYCLVENKLFRIHRYFFERESKFFKAQLAIPATPGGPRIGTADDSAILLDNVRSTDFAKLLWVFYNPKYSLYDASIEDWATILELAERWAFAEVKNLAVRELEKKTELPDIDRIVLYHKFHVDETYLVPRYAALCERPELLTVEEGLRLGMEVVIALSRARECARNSASSGARSPSPASLGDKELTDIIKDQFNIKPAQQPTGGWVTLSFAGLALIDVQQQNRRHHNRHPVQSPTKLVPEPGTRHLQEMAASQTPTEPEPMAPAQIERRTTQGEEVAREELDEDDGGESGDDSETVKAESDDGEGDHKSSCDEVKVVADKGEESEHKTAEDELSTNSDVQTLVVNPDSELTAGDSSGAHERVGTPGERVGTPVTPPIDVDVSSSESDEDDEFYDSPEDPDSFDAFSVP